MGLLLQPNSMCRRALRADVRLWQHNASKTSQFKETKAWLHPEVRPPEGRHEAAGKLMAASTKMGQLQPVDDPHSVKVSSVCHEAKEKLGGMSTFKTSQNKSKASRELTSQHVPKASEHAELPGMSRNIRRPSLTAQTSAHRLEVINPHALFAGEDVSLTMETVLVHEANWDSARSRQTGPEWRLLGRKFW